MSLGTSLFFIIFLLILVLVMVVIDFNLLLMFLKWRRPLPFVPITQKAVSAVIKSICLVGKRNIVDLGCGTGTFIAKLKKHYPEANFFGVENDKLLARIAHLRFFFYRKKPEIILGDMFKYPLHDIDAVIGFWITDFTPRLMEKFIKECRPGCIIISVTFALPKSEFFVYKEIRFGKHRTDVIHLYQKVSDISTNSTKAGI